MTVLKELAILGEIKMAKMLIKKSTNVRQKTMKVAIPV